MSFKGFYNGYCPVERHRKADCRIHYRQLDNILACRSCEICGQYTADLEPHSEDYSLPYIFNQHFLCRTCHRTRLHSRFRNPRAWNSFKNLTLGKALAKVQESPWWGRLSSCPRSRWTFDARPRAVNDVVSAIRAVEYSCNALQFRALRVLARFRYQSWTFDVLSREAGFGDPAIFKRLLNSISEKMASCIGYEAPVTGAGISIPILILASPEEITTALPYRFARHHPWRTNQAFGDAFDALNLEQL